MSFEVPATAYDRFMGRFSTPLAALFADHMGVAAGQRAVDVGCGPGALTELLVDRLGPAAVAAIDPSESFVAAIRERLPEVDVRCGSAEVLPFADDSFDVAAAQLVVHFMSDPAAGIAEMARVTRPDGIVAACVWDQGSGDGGPIAPFWQAARDVDPDRTDESGRAGTQEGQLVALFMELGLRRIAPAKLTVSVQIASFAEWWEPFTLGVGPAGRYLESLDEQRRTALRDRCAQLLPAGAFVVEASAWSAVGRV